MNDKGCVTILTLFATSITAIAEIATGGKIIGKFLCDNVQVCIGKPGLEPEPTVSSTPIEEPPVSPKPPGKNITISKLAEKFQKNPIQFYNVHKDSVKNITGDINIQSIRKCYYPPRITYSGQSQKESQCLSLYYSFQGFSNYVVCYFPPNKLEQVQQLSREIDDNKEEDLKSIIVRAKMLVNKNAYSASSGITLTDCQLIK